MLSNRPLNGDYVLATTNNPRGLYPAGLSAPSIRITPPKQILPLLDHSLNQDLKLLPSTLTSSSFFFSPPPASNSSCHNTERTSSQGQPQVCICNFKLRFPFLSAPNSICALRGSRINAVPCWRELGVKSCAISHPAGWLRLPIERISPTKTDKSSNTGPPSFLPTLHSVTFPSENLYSPSCPLISTPDTEFAVTH